jgi:hypothetical protein
MLLVCWGKRRKVRDCKQALYLLALLRYFFIYPSLPPPLAILTSMGIVVILVAPSHSCSLSEYEELRPPKLSPKAS